MPRKFSHRRHKRHNRRHKRSRLHKKKNFISDKMIIYRAPTRLPYPPKFMTKLYTGITGVYASGDTSLVNQVGMNFVYLPFYVHGLNAAFTDFAGSLQTLTTLNPVGYSDLCNSALYSSYRVIASKIKVQLIPSETTDTALLVVVPTIGQYDSGGNSIVPSVISSATEAQDVPFSKDKLVAANQQGSAIRSTMSSPKMFGLTKKQYMDDEYAYSSAYNARPVNYALWNICMETADAAVTTGTIAYRIDVEYWVEFFNQNTQNITQS